MTRDGKRRSVLAQPDRSPTEPDAPEPGFGPAGRAGPQIFQDRPVSVGPGQDISKVGPGPGQGPWIARDRPARPDFGPTLDRLLDVA